MVKDLQVQAVLESRVLDLPMLNGGKEKTTLRDLIEPKITLIVFIRHFACISCHEHIRDWIPYLEGFVSKNISVIVIGNGDASFIKGFVERFELEKYPVSVCTDTSLKIHEHLELRHSWSANFSIHSLRNVVRAFRKGNRQVELQGSTSQQGGLILLNEKREVHLLHREMHMGDFLPPKKVVEAIEALT